MAASLFSIISEESTTGSVSAILGINKDHGIFKGHFPGQPVVPGVCMLQVAKELTERHIKKTMQVVEASNIKFLSVMNPLEVDRVDATVLIHEHDVDVEINATLFSGPAVYFKLKATLRKV